MAELVTARASEGGLDEFESLLAKLSGRFINVAPKTLVAGWREYCTRARGTRA
jgi:hypothetical protein